MQIVNPPELGPPRGFAHGIVAAAGGRVLYVAGQTAADYRGVIDDQDFVAQFDTSLAKVLHVVQAAGGEPLHIARLTIYVTDLAMYRASRPSLRDVWSRRMGAHYPAMALVQVSGLVDAGATIEIQADAVIP